MRAMTCLSVAAGGSNACIGSLSLGGVSQSAARTEFPRKPSDTLGLTLCKSGSEGLAPFLRHGEFWGERIWLPSGGLGNADAGDLPNPPWFNQRLRTNVLAGAPELTFWLHSSWPACSYLLLAFLHLSRSLSGLLISSQAGSRRSHLKKICFPPFSCHPASMKKVKSESRTVMSDSAILWTVTGPAPLSIGFSRPEYWSRLIFPSPGDPPHPGIEPRSPS